MFNFKENWPLPSSKEKREDAKEHFWLLRTQRDKEGSTNEQRAIISSDTNPRAEPEYNQNGKLIFYTLVNCHIIDKKNKSQKINIVQIDELPKTWKPDENGIVKPTTEGGPASHFINKKDGLTVDVSEAVEKKIKDKTLKLPPKPTSSSRFNGMTIDLTPGIFKKMGYKNVPDSHPAAQGKDKEKTKSTISMPPRRSKRRRRRKPINE